MSFAPAPAATVPASRLRARNVNTSHAAPAKTSTKSSVTKRVASPKSSAVRPRTPATATTTPTSVTVAAHNSLFSSSVTRRVRGSVKPVAPGRSNTPAGEENNAAALITIPTNTSHLSGRGGNAVHPAPATATNAPLVKTSSRTKRTASSSAAHYNSGRASRLDSVCSSLPGTSSDRGSVHRVRVPPQHPPPVPHLAAVVAPRPAPLARAATTECVLRSARQQAAEERTKTSTPPPPEADVPVRPQLSPRRATALANRPIASAPASRVSSVNSRLADANPSSAASPAAPAGAIAVSRAPRTRVVRTAGKRSASSNSDLGASAPLSASTAFSAVPPRAAGVRPLLPAGRRVARRDAANTSTAAPGGVARQRTRNASAPLRSSSQAEAGSRSARGANGTAAAPAHNAPLSGRRVAGASPSRKGATRRASEAADGARIPPPPPSSKFQQTHTGCPPPLTFGGGGSAVRGAALSTAARGPISPIKRTSTACPSGAQVYPPVATCEEDAARDSAGVHGAAAADSAFSCPWLKPGAFSTPTNRDGGRESSEAPTVPYEGSTGQRASMSLSPRTDFDTMSVSGRLSYGM